MESSRLFLEIHGIGLNLGCDRVWFGRGIRVYQFPLFNLQIDAVRMQFFQEILLAHRNHSLWLADDEAWLPEVLEVFIIIVVF